MAIIKTYPYAYYNCLLEDIQNICAPDRETIPMGKHFTVSLVC